MCSSLFSPRVVAKVVALLELKKALDLDLADAFAGDPQELADFFERYSPLVGDVERTGSRQLVELVGADLGEIELDGPGAWVDVEVEMKLATDPRAGPLVVLTVAAGPWPIGEDLALDNLTRQQP
jgi:hypothetical protein